MTSNAIHPDTVLGPVHLLVHDLGPELEFYQQRLGLTLRDALGATAFLGTADADLLVLAERREAPRPRRAPGLYHVALRVPSRPALALSLERLLATRTTLQGAADHGVSEALYLADPEGNGIEIYHDRPREEWPVEDGRIAMASDPLPLEELLGEARGRSSTGLPDATRVGHVHLHVSRLDEAERFYVDVLGFERMGRLGEQAVFLSAGGYHHHVGLNTWLGTGMPPRPEGAAGLDHFVIALPDGAALEAVLARARAAGIRGLPGDGGFRMSDPSGNRLVLSAQRVAAKS